MKLKLLLVSAFALLLLVPAHGQDAKKELAKFGGTWKVVRAEEDKNDVPAVVVEALTLVIKGDQISLKGVEDLIAKFGKITLKLDPGTTPRCIDFKIEAGTEKGITYEGIYELKGDELKMCVSTVNGNRPNIFETAAGSNRALIVLKREKSK